MKRSAHRSQGPDIGVAKAARTRQRPLLQLLNDAAIMQNNARARRWRRYVSLAGLHHLGASAGNGGEHAYCKEKTPPLGGEQRRGLFGHRPKAGPTRVL